MFIIEETLARLRASALRRGRRARCSHPFVLFPLAIGKYVNKV